MRYNIIITLFLGILSLFSMASSTAFGKVELTGQDAELCFKCHKDIEDKFKMSYLHTPVKEKKCSGCHNSHTSRFPKLIIKKDKELCLTCHEEQFKKYAQENIHTPAKMGECLVCHDPHGSNNKGVLVRTEKEICISCHGDILSEKLTFQHPLFKEGKCSECHSPHASKEKNLLVRDTSHLCANCHKTDTPKIKNAHAPFDMKGVPCTPCHSPHAADNKYLINEYAHSAVRMKKCDVCHTVTDKDPVKTKLSGSALCYSCHTKNQEEFKTGRAHPLVEKGNCAGCHTPHASGLKGLVKGRERIICLDGCHKEIVDKTEAYTFRHKDNVEKGRCTICHASHNSSEPRLLAKNPEAVCRSCHGATTPGMKFGHPSGPGVFDLRDKDKKTLITCVTCHDSHGTFYAFHLRLSGASDLCIQCHETGEGEEK